ncbi:YfjI family protein, partial [Streptomyces sp. NPDC002078]
MSGGEQAGDGGVLLIGQRPPHRLLEAVDGVRGPLAGELCRTVVEALQGLAADAVLSVEDVLGGVAVDGRHDNGAEGRHPHCVAFDAENLVAEPIQAVRVCVDAELQGIRDGRQELRAAERLLVRGQPRLGVEHHRGKLIQRRDTRAVKHADRRQIAALGTRLIQAARDSGEDHDELLATARQALARTTVEERWPAPTPLGQQGPLPTFPVDALPAWVAEQVAAVAEFTQTPADMAATMALAALSTAAGGRVYVQIRDGWVEQTNLYLVVAMPPASRKSDVFAAMTRPIYDVEAAMQEDARPSIIEAEVAKEAAEARAEAILAKARKADDSAAATSLVAEAAGLRMEAESIAVPPKPRLTASGDVTPETLTKLLSTHGRLRVLSPEGDLFDIIAGRYSSRPNLGVFLQGHKGERLQAERITRETDLGEKPAFTIGISLQPPVLMDLAQTPGARGRGLLARFLFSLPAPTLDYRKIVVPPVPEKTSRAYESHLTTLVHTLTDLPEPVTIKCSGPADQAVIKLQEDIEPQLRPDGPLAHIDDWAGKYVGAVARIAGLLHLADRATGRWGEPIEATTIERAIAIGEYYTAHALAAFGLMETDTDTEKAQQVLEWIRRTKVSSFKTPSHLEYWVACWRGNRGAAGAGRVVGTVPA